MFGSDFDVEGERMVRMFQALVFGLASIMDADYVSMDATGLHIGWMDTPLTDKDIAERLSNISTEV